MMLTLSISLLELSSLDMKAQVTVGAVDKMLRQHTIRLSTTACTPQTAPTQHHVDLEYHTSTQTR